MEKGGGLASEGHKQYKAGYEYAAGGLAAAATGGSRGGASSDRAGSVSSASARCSGDGEEEGGSLLSEHMVRIAVRRPQHGVK